MANPGPDRDRGHPRGGLQPLTGWNMNDMLNLAGLMYTARSYGPRELTRCGEILDRINAKIQDMECCLTGRV